MTNPTHGHPKKPPFLDCDAHLRTELGVLSEVKRGAW